MSDLTPNYNLEREAKLLKAEELKLNIRRQKYRMLQLQDEQQRLQDNIAATENAVEEIMNTIEEEGQADA